MRIATVNLKGGTGKTTSLVLLALAFEKSGARIGIVDRDPQQKSATKWVSNYESNLVELAREGEEYDYVLIDTPPRIESRELAQSVKDADKVLLVTSASPLDSWSSQDFVEIMKTDVKGRGHILFNKVDPKTILDRDLSGVAKQIGLPPLVANLRSRKPYQYAVLLGWSALPPVAREEILILANEVQRV